MHAPPVVEEGERVKSSRNHASTDRLNPREIQPQVPAVIILTEDDLAIATCHRITENVPTPVLYTDARSLKHAFTLLSTKFKTERISHTGNVFAHVFFRGKMGWHSLNEARGKIDLLGS